MKVKHKHYLSLCSRVFNQLSLVINHHTMRIYINESANYYKPVKYTLGLVNDFCVDSFEFISSKDNCEMIIDHKDSKSIGIDEEFYDKFDNGDLSHQNILHNETLIKDNRGKVDFLTTIFYLVNCLQEYTTKEDQKDHLGRFLYEKSWQKQYNSIEDNVVLNLIEQFISENNIQKTQDFQSKIFVSHDIDSVNGSFMQDGFWAIKRGRLDIVLSLIIKEVFNRKEWRNIDQIIKLNSEFDIKSTFFWLVNKGVGTDNIRNADYLIDNQRGLISTVHKNSSFNGLHKSCSTDSINQELQKLPSEVTINRHHFLNFKLPELFNQVEESKLNFDSSLGFAERYGFRNGFAMPFIPYNIEQDKPYSFVEMPLMVMDGSFQKYLKIPMHETANIAISFFEKHKYNSYLSFLWHNTHFTNYKYKGYKEEYIKIIKYLYESNFEFVSPEEIIQKNFQND